jgi:hypothetical protein
MGIIDQISKPSLVQKHTRIKVYKTARPILTYGNEAWTICKSDKTRRTAGYIKSDKKRNTEIPLELNINSVLEHIDQYTNNWKEHVQRTDRSRIPRPIVRKAKDPLEDPLNAGERPWEEEEEDKL